MTLTRKNALFAGSDGGARHWALAMTLIQTAKLNGVDPMVWLTERWCTEVGKLTVSPAICSGYATRTEIGLAIRIIRLSASTAIAISPC
jgi:hypothetical protein